MAWYDQYINPVFAPPPPPISSTNGQQNTSGNGTGRGFWNGGFADRMAGGFQDLMAQAQRGRAMRRPGLFPGQLRKRIPMQQPQFAFTPGVAAPKPGIGGFSPDQQAGIMAEAAQRGLGANSNATDWQAGMARGFAPQRTPYIGDRRKMALRRTY